MILAAIVAASLTLAWDPSSDAVSYRLYVGILPGESITWYPTTDTSFVVTGLDFGTKYYFRATAFNAEGIESGYSNEVSWTPVPPTPTPTPTPEPTPTPTPTPEPTPDDGPGQHKGWYK